MVRVSRRNITYALGVIIIIYMLLLARFHVHVEEHHAADARRAEPPTPRRHPNAFHLIDRKSHWYNTDIKEHDIAFRCGHRHDFKAGCKWLRLSWPV